MGTAAGRDEAEGHAQKQKRWRPPGCLRAPTHDSSRRRRRRRSCPHWGSHSHGSGLSCPFAINPAFKCGQFQLQMANSFFQTG